MFKTPRKTSTKILLGFLVFSISYIIGKVVIGPIGVMGINYIPIDKYSVGESMYPTFSKDGVNHKMYTYPSGLTLLGKRYFEYKITHGDIVIVKNDMTNKTTEEGHDNPSIWCKRVIAIEGDTLELRDGIVFLNGEPQKEQYIESPRSTFGGSFLQECQMTTVPENSVFVMGDNRRISYDSRYVGFFDLEDIEFVYPFLKQKDSLSQNWRDTTNDLTDSSKIKFDKEEYLKLINQKRDEEGLKPLKYNEKLELSAKLRGETILKYNDFSQEATASGFTIEKATNQVDYFSNYLKEFSTIGYYRADEFFNYQIDLYNLKELIVDDLLLEIGITEVSGEIDGCPINLIVQHFGE